MPEKGPTLLRNANCLYCGADLLTVEHNKEHVIGRGFVPDGVFEGTGWNLIARACVLCNRRKGILEGEISAVTMMPSVSGEWASDDPRLRSTMERKAPGAMSSATRMPVAESRSKNTITAPFGPLTMTANFVGEPYVPREQFHELARFHSFALFGFLTFNDKTRLCGFYEGTYFGVAEAVKSDWGNPLLRGFSELTTSWDPRLWINGADGFFRAVIRRRPGDGPRLWSLAMEWNMRYRVVAFFGDEQLAEREAQALPRAKATRLDANTRMWTETRIRPADDTLFHRPDWPDDARTSQKLDVRSQRRKNSGRLGVLEPGSCVVVLEKRRKWTKVSRMVDPATPPLEGWVLTRYVTVPKSDY